MLRITRAGFYEQRNGDVVYVSCKSGGRLIYALNQKGCIDTHFDDGSYCFGSKGPRDIIKFLHAFDVWKFYDSPLPVKTNPFNVGDIINVYAIATLPSNKPEILVGCDMIVKSVKGEAVKAKGNSTWWHYRQCELIKKG